MRILLACLLLLSACSKGSSVMEDLPNSSAAGAARQDVPDTRMDAGQSRAVTIGEDGPRLNACSGMGQVARVGAKGLPVRAAPFADARETAHLAEGDRAFVCARSLDQKWLGLVIPLATGPAAHAAEPVDCGVTDPADRKQAYVGPCASGWVASASIRLVG